MSIDVSNPGITEVKAPPKGEEDKCLICYTRVRHNRQFASCTHKSTCLKCAEERMKSYVKEKEWPKCMEENCEASMVTSGRLCIFQYFSQDSKKIWEQYLKNPKKSSTTQVKPCQKPNCSGIIVKSRCLKCSNLYCEICKQPSHPPGTLCRRPNQLQIVGLKQCPNCRQNYVRDAGCHHVKCSSCSHEFCEVCNKAWSFGHHSCRQLRGSEGSLTLNTIKKSRGCYGQSCIIF